MKVIDCVQGSPEWIQARLGMPTASNFDRIITPAKGENVKGTAVNRYLARLCAEWYLGCSLDEAVTGFMERGTEMEAEAVNWYEFTRNVETIPVGFCVTDDAIAGASPDRLVGGDGGLEIKCPTPEVHMSYFLHGLPADYRCQVQGCLWVTGRKWWDFLSFHPSLPRVLVRTERDEEFIKKLEPAVRAFAWSLDAAKARLSEQKAEREAVLAAADTGF